MADRPIRGALVTVSIIKLCSLYSINLLTRLSGEIVGSLSPSLSALAILNSGTQRRVSSLAWFLSASIAACQHSGSILEGILSLEEA